MAERLRALVASADATRNMFLNERRVESARQRLQSAADAREQIRTRSRLALELLLAGSTLESLEQFMQVEQSVKEANLLDARTAGELNRLIGLACLRRGEQENCLARHGVDSCLMPLRGSGIHVEQRGARDAIARFSALTRADPNNLSFRWLLNLAYMAVGEYPAGVPEDRRIPPAIFESEGPCPRFYDVAPALNLNRVGLSGGAIMEDFDADGFLDVMISSWGLADPLRYYRNNGDGTFSDQTSAAGLDGLTGGLNLCQADYNNDGFADALVLRGAWLAADGAHPNSLLRNNGDRTFEDVTEQAGLLSFHPTQTGAWGDFDNDGWIDLFIGNESTSQSRHPCELYRNNGDGTFTNVAAAAGLDHVGFVKAAVWGDYDNDGRIDLYLSRLGQPNLMYRNNGPRTGRPRADQPSTERPAFGWSFTEVATTAGVGQPLRSFPTWFCDYDNDGWLDLFVAPFAPEYGASALDTVVADYLGLPHQGERCRLFRNQRDGTFADVTASARLDRATLAMGANFGDIDNDGYPDFYLGTGDPDLGTLIPNRMFRNVDGRTFQDVTTAGGFGHVQKGHGVAFGDIDNDGDQDIYVVLGGAYSGDVYQNVLLLNPGGWPHHWLTLKLEGVRSNRAAIGARIRVVVETEAGERSVFATVSSGGSFGASSLQQEIGLGRATRIAWVEVTWPASGTTQRFDDVAMDRAYRIREGMSELLPMPQRPIDLSPAVESVLKRAEQR